MKNDFTNVAATTETEDGANEPMQPEQLFPIMMQDIMNDEDPEALADDFFEQFVDASRPEAAHIIGLLDLPNETIFQLVANMQAQTFNVFISKAPDYLAKLRIIVGTRLTDRARSK